MIERPMVSPRILGFSKLVNIENPGDRFRHRQQHPAGR
jgi:hypothetical protein